MSILRSNKGKKKKVRLKLKLSGWNVWIIIDNPLRSSPELRKNTLVSKELESYYINESTLLESRLAGDGQFQVVGCGYTFFWKGNCPEDDRGAGMGISLCSTYVTRVAELSKEVNEHSILFRLHLN